jgi:hypothetical protein
VQLRVATPMRDAPRIEDAALQQRIAMAGEKILNRR